MNPRGMFDEYSGSPQGHLLVRPATKSLVPPEDRTDMTVQRGPMAPLVSSTTKETSCTKKQKSVSFFPQVQVRPIESLDHFTNEMIDSLWFTESEYGLIRKNIRSSVKLMKETKDLPRNEIKDMFRGLEGRTKAGIKFRSLCRTAVWTAVFLEQESQMMEGQVNEMMIAQASTAASFACRKIARDNALHDECAVLRDEDC